MHGYSMQESCKYLARILQEFYYIYLQNVHVSGQITCKIASFLQGMQDYLQGSAFSCTDIISKIVQVLARRFYMGYGLMGDHDGKRRHWFVKC